MLSRPSRYQCHVFTDLVGIQWVIFMPMATIALVDFIVASSLCYLLATSRTGFSRSGTV
ncbi:hypothetical protein AZE42_05622 [Rhizopogon vesiculosus]|uniref:Uncharacterized protein n=1 Tax=Rhizopogon vesiculosus TaxID=180088 RepID=A0A1J8QGD8_9AGAM|nr:hypothetical protein AZE42_05622 [Rhizopogon vesiculosus]